MTSYGIVAYDGNNNCIFGKVGTNTNHNTHVLNTCVFNCCGLAGIHSLGKIRPTSFAEQADYLAGLFIYTRGPGHIMYVITDKQSCTVPSQDYYHSYEHKALLLIGAEMVYSFPNLTHGPCRCEVWMVNIRDGIGRFFDEDGVPYKVPPAVAVPPVDKVKRKYVRKVQPHPLVPVAPAVSL